MVTSRIALTICLIISASARAAQQAADFTEPRAAIAKGQDTPARRRPITDSLQAAALKIGWRNSHSPDFSGPTSLSIFRGRMLGKIFLLGAHYDRVSVGENEVDNAVSCAVLLELLKKFKGNPLNSFSIRGVFFDLEEAGRVGSQAYLASLRDKQMPAHAVNLDIFGYGDTRFGAASSLEGSRAQALQRAAQETSLQVRLVEPARYPASDHRPMIASGIDTLGLSLIDGAEIDPILQRSPRRRGF